MALALYHPEHGYYERDLDQVGHEGDFLTSVSVGPLFGALLGWRFAHWLEPLSADAACHLVEAGAHQGQLAHDVLTWLLANQPRLLDRTTYCIVEPSARRRERQHEFLHDFADYVRWFTDLEELRTSTGGVRGVIFSNELLDAFPVHRLAWSSAERSWMEQGVAIEDDEFKWTTLGRASDAQPPLQLEDALANVLPDGFTVESSPAAIDWWRQAADSLIAGRLLAFDYGHEAREFFDPARAQGTLRGYRKHAHADNVLAAPGEQDLTAHVNWTAIRDAGEDCGLRTATLTPQGHFLTAALRDQAAADPAAANLTPKQIRQFQTLTHPQHFGTRFQVLVQARSV